MTTTTRKHVRFEVIRSTTNKSRWTIRQLTDDGPNIVHGFSRFTSKKAAQDWVDRLNAAFSGDEPC